ncbi:MAG: ATP-binding cassette domain-containing protein [Bacteroidales bacterium]|nr:ATP-binding cassette domain-containing protein [Bacteroidales bacterium]
MGTILSINNLHKRYGKIHAVNNLSLEIEQGSVFGILGPNGSGKTTTLGIILGVVNANDGSFSWFGLKNSKADRKRIGAILEQPIFYPYLSADKNLQIVANIKEVGYSDIERVLKTVELYERRDSKFKTFSYGMKQRLAIASALLGNPEVLIFDEPTNGLDPTGIAEIRELIIKIAGQGVTILLASHLLDEVQKTCTHVAVLKSGKKLFSGKVSDVLNLSDSIEVYSENLQMLHLALNEFKGLKEVETEKDMILARLESGLTASDLNSYLVEKGIVLSHLALRKKNLEQQFLELLNNKE